MKRILFTSILSFFCLFLWGQNFSDTLFYENGNIQEIRPRCDSTKQLHGTCIAYTLNGDTLAIANYKHGVKDGLWKIWRENGSLAYELHYAQGKKVGIWKFYDLQGNLTERKYTEETF